MLPSWANDTIIRLRPGETEKRGSIVPDWDNPQTLSVSGCSMQPSSTSLSQDGRVLGITEGYTCYLPPGTDVAAGDKIRFENKDYQIIGEPRTWTSPTGRVNSIQVQLERWKG